MKRMLLKVEDAFHVSGQGLILAPGLSVEEHPVSNNIPVLITRPDGSEINSTIDVFYPFPVPTPKEPKNFCRFKDLDKNEVPIGSEIWLR